MLEFLLCSSVTILPDYLVRRYAQGKRWGREITFFTMWYELRWGITACLLLTISLITLIFYYHPSTSSVNSFFRTVTVLPETPGRVKAVHVRNGERVAAGEPLFTLDAASQETAVETARRRIDEVDAAVSVAEADLAAAESAVREARAALAQIQDELDRKLPLFEAGSSAVTDREIDQLRIRLDQRQGGLEAAEANREAALRRLEIQLPASRETAEAALAEAEAALDKMVVRAGTDGILEQFYLQPGDYISSVLRPAGILVPAGANRVRFTAGFGQISAQVIEVGMIAEVTCASKPFTVIPMVVTQVQDVIAAGQFRPSDSLLDVQDRAREGTLTVALEPLYPGQADDVPPGSRCIANAYTSNHDALAEGGLSTGTWLFYHVVDATGLIHAFILRSQALLMPMQTLVFTGH